MRSIATLYPRGLISRGCLNEIVRIRVLVIPLRYGASPRARGTPCYSVRAIVATSAAPRGNSVDIARCVVFDITGMAVRGATQIDDCNRGRSDSSRGRSQAIDRSRRSEAARAVSKAGERRRSHPSDRPTSADRGQPVSSLHRSTPQQHQEKGPPHQGAVKPTQESLIEEPVVTFAANRAVASVGCGNGTGNERFDPP